MLTYSHGAVVTRSDKQGGHHKCSRARGTVVVDIEYRHSSQTKTWGEGGREGEGGRREGGRGKGGRREGGRGREGEGGREGKGEGEGGKERGEGVRMEGGREGREKDREDEG